MNLGNMHTSNGLNSDFAVFTGNDYEPLSRYKVKLCMAVDPIAQLEGVILDSKLGSISHGWRIGRAKFIDSEGMIICCVGFANELSHSAVSEASSAALKWCEKSGMAAWFDLTESELLKGVDANEVIKLLYSIADVAPLSHFTRSHGIKVPLELERCVSNHCCKNPVYHAVTLVRISAKVQQNLRDVCGYEDVSARGSTDVCGNVISDKIVSLEDIAEIYRKVPPNKVECAKGILTSGARYLQVNYSWAYKVLNEVELAEFKGSAVVSERANKLMDNPV